jgi:hypothetical protein
LWDAPYFRFWVGPPRIFLFFETLLQKAQRVPRELIEIGGDIMGKKLEKKKSKSGKGTQKKQGGGKRR